MSLSTILDILEWLWKHLKPSKLLLLVEDNSKDALMLCEDMKEQHINYELAQSAEEALSLMRRTRFYCALIDVGLPGMNGMSLSAKMKERGYKTRVFYITGSSFVNLLPGQHINIIRKPVNADELREIIK